MESMKNKFKIISLIIALTCPITFCIIDVIFKPVGGFPFYNDYLIIFTIIQTLLCLICFILEISRIKSGKKGFSRIITCILILGIVAFIGIKSYFAWDKILFDGDRLECVLIVEYSVALILLIYLFFLIRDLIINPFKIPTPKKYIERKKRNESKYAYIKLKELKDLYDSGILSKEEYENRKQEYLNKL